ncbi:HAD family acid phosphatase [Corynebacterium freiburgense]
MDGTLCDVRSIRYFVTENPKHRNFHKFHNASIDCPAHPKVVQLYKHLQQQGLATIIVTARTSNFSFLTNLWLQEQGLTHSGLFMRARKDSRPDHDIKKDLLAEICKRFTPVLAVDDRPQIAEIWQNNGIFTVLVSEEGELSYAVPENEISPVLSDYL